MNAVVRDRNRDLDIRPMAGGLGAEITGFDFGAPISDERFDAVSAAFLEWQVLVFSSGEVRAGATGRVRPALRRGYRFTS